MSKKFIKPLFIGMALLAMLTIGFNMEAVAAEPIKLGAPIPMTGNYASDGVGYRNGIEMAVKEINESGGILGRPVEIVQFDTQDLAPETVMRAADQLVGIDKVDSIHAGWAGWGQDIRTYGKYDVPTFVWDGSDAAIQVYIENPKKYSNMFMMVEGERAHAVDIWEMMMQVPYDYPNKKVAIINGDDSWGRGIGNGVAEQAKKSGWDVVMHEVVPIGNREWRPLLTKIRATEPAIIHVEISSTPDMMTLFRQFMESPTNSILNFSYGSQFPDFIENMKGEIDGLLGISNGLPFPKAPTPEANAWLVKYKKTYKQDSTPGAWMCYNGIKFWAEAVKAVENVKDYAAINEYIATTPFKSISGGDWKFTDDHFLPFNVNTPLLHFQAQGGQMITIYTAPGKPYLDYKFQVPSWIKK